MAPPPPEPEQSGRGGMLNTSSSVITVTMNEVPGYRVVRVLGTVYGLTVQSRNWAADIGAFLKSAVGGELKFLTNMVYKGRTTAVDRMIGETLAKGGNAVLALRYDTSELGIYVQTCAYGTACLLEKIEDGGVEAKGSNLAT